MTENEITERTIGAAIEVHSVLGPGLLESIYEECLCWELSQAGLKFQRQVNLPVNHKGLKLTSAYRMDLLVEETVVVEIKSTEEMPPIYAAQVLTYKRIVNNYLGLPPRLRVSASKGTS